MGESGESNLYGYVNNRPMNSTDLLGLLAQIYVYRTSPTSQASVVVYENNVYLGSTWGNQRGFYSDRAPHPPPDGIYGVTQRTDYQEGDNFANGILESLILTSFTLTAGLEGALRSILSGRTEFGILSKEMPTQAERPSRTLRSRTPRRFLMMGRCLRPRSTRGRHFTDFRRIEIDLYV